MSINMFPDARTIGPITHSLLSAINISGGNLNVENAKQIAAQLHKPIRHKFSIRKVIVYNLDEIWACDLLDFSKILYTTNA